MRGFGGNGDRVMEVEWWRGRPVFSMELVAEKQSKYVLFSQFVVYFALCNIKSGIFVISFIPFRLRVDDFFIFSR